MKVAMFIVLLTASAFGQDPSYVVSEKYMTTLANMVRRLKAIEDSCRSFVAQTQTAFEKVAAERTAAELLIVSLKSTVSDYKEQVRLAGSRDSLRLVQIEAVREESKPSWLESVFSVVGKGAAAALVILVAVLVLK